MFKAILSLVILLATSQAFAKTPITLTHQGGGALAPQLKIDLESKIAHSNEFEPATNQPTRYVLTLLTLGLKTGGIDRGTSYAFSIESVNGDEKKPIFLGSNLGLCAMRPDECADDIITASRKIIAQSKADH